MNNKQVNKENDKEEVNVTKGFFKKAYKSITDFEQYPELAAQGTWSAIRYLAILVIFFTITILIGMMIQFRIEFNAAISKFDQSVPELTYNNGILDVKSENPIIIEDGIEGKMIIDTKTEDSSQIAEYEKVDSTTPNKVILLKDKVIMISTEHRTMTFTYQEISNKLQNSNLNNFNKADLLNYIDSEGKYMIYAFYALTMLVVFFIIYFITIFFDAITIAVLGYITSMFANLKIRFAAIFNMSIYALTLSVILNAIYTIIKLYTDFNIEYFDIAYIAVAYIYIAAAIFLLKANFIKKQSELMKIVEEQAKVKIEIKEKENKKEEKEKDDDNNKEKEDTSKKEKKDDNNLNDSPEGSKA